MRSPYQIEQFEAALQKLAHEIPKFHRISSEEITLNFYYDDQGRPRRIAVQLGPEIDYWGFTIEKKLYTTSPDSCKIDCMEQNADRIKKWLQEIMGAEKPKPRFKISDVTSKENRKV